MLRLLKFLKPYKKLVAAILPLTILQTLGTLYIPTLNADIINNGIAKGDITYIARTGIFMLAIAALTGVFALIISQLSANISSLFSRDIRQTLFRQTQALSINDFNTIGTASMITRATSDVTLIGQMTVMFIQMLFPAPIMAIGGLFLAFAKDRIMALIIVITMLVFLVIAFVLGKKVIPLFTQVQIKMDNLTRILRETIIGVRVIRSFNRELYEKKRIDTVATDYMANSIKINKLISILQPMALIIINSGVVCILWVGGKRVVTHTMNLGDIMAMIEYCFLILYFLIMGIIMFMYIPRAQASADRINEVLSITPEIADASLAATKTDDYAHIEFRNVTFLYPNAEEEVLSELSFESKSGEITAIIGATGSGKSTIASLISRFYEIQSGCILLDGIDIRKLPQKTLRDKIGYVPQKAFLFSGTISHNISYGKENATQEQIQYAAQVAQADDFITQMEQGYASHVAQGGNNLSGGQKQRLAIARALIRKPELYIFDDSFSALDFNTDAKLRKALKQEIGKSTVLIIAQRISTIMDADRIIVLEDGKIAGIGKHNDLMKTCDIYKQIAASQLSEQELA